MGSWTLQHLPDQLGTYVEFFNLLRVGGIMVTDHMQYKVLDNEKPCYTVPRYYLAIF